MDSGFRQQQYQHHFQDQQRQLNQQKQQMSGGLTRYRSAPSSYFSSFLDAAAETVNTNTTATPGGGGEREDFPNARPLSPETENIFARFMSSMNGESNASGNQNQKLCDIPENSAVQQDFLVEVKQERETLQQPQQHYQQQQQQQQGGYSNSSQQMMYQSQSQPPLVNQKTFGVENSFRPASASASGGNSMGMHSLPQMNSNNTSNSGLTRHSSSPAGFFNSILDMDNGFGIIKGMENYGASGGQSNVSQGQPSSTSGLMTQNSDIGSKRFRSSTNNNNSNNNDSNYMTGYSMNSWDDSILSENFSSLDRGDGDDGMQIFSELNASENQSGEGRNRPQLLAHHLSLPSSSMEKLLQFQDTTVPCRIRAKRGCATHPRSIAERVRRTRISERMRKLQDLVPSMDKQTNTADMLDLAVEYIKDLQNQVKNLDDKRANCTCSK